MGKQQRLPRSLARHLSSQRETIGVIAIPARPSTRPKPRSSYRGCTLLLVDALNDAHAGGKTSSKPLFLSLCSFFFCRDFSFPVFFAVIYRRRLACNNQLKQQVSTSSSSSPFSQRLPLPPSLILSSSSDCLRRSNDGDDGQRLRSHPCEWTMNGA